MAADSFRRAVEESKPLTKEEELELSNKIREGDIEARNKLVEANLRFVYYIVKEQYNITHRLEFEEVVNHGVLGLVEAAKRFDASHNCRFSTYAKHWIKKMINKYIYGQATIVKVPPVRVKLVHDIHGITERLQHHRPEYEISDEMVAEKFGVSSWVLPTVKAAFNSSPIDSVEEPAQDINKSEFDEEMDHIDIISRETSKLSPMKRDIVCRYYGIGCPAQTLQEISMIYVLSRERIRQIKKKALDQIKERLGLDP